MTKQEPQEQSKKSIHDMQRVMGWLEVIHKDNVLTEIPISEQKRFAITLTRMVAMAQAFVKTHSSEEILALQEPQMICPKAKECKQVCAAKYPHELNKSCKHDKFEIWGDCPACIPYIPETATCPECGDAINLHDKDGCHGTRSTTAGAFMTMQCICKRTPADLQPEQAPSEPIPLIEQTSEQELADGIARHLLAEWLAINANKTRLEACEHWDEAQELQDWLYIIGYRNIAKSPTETIVAHDQQVRKAFAEEILLKMPCSKIVPPQTASRDYIDGSFTQFKASQAHIRVMAREEGR